mgnify:FL=1
MNEETVWPNKTGIDEPSTEPLSLADLADTLLAAKEAKRVAAEAESAANKEIERVELLLIAAMAEQEIEKFAHANQLFFPVVQSFPSVVKELEDGFIAWLTERNEQGIYKYTVHSQTLKGFYNQHDEWHEELSEKGFLKVHEKIRIGTRKQ